MPGIWLFSFFGSIAGFFSSQSPQIDANLHILGLLSQKKGSQLNSLRSLSLVLAYFCCIYEVCGCLSPVSCVLCCICIYGLGCICACSFCSFYLRTCNDHEIKYFFPLCRSADFDSYWYRTFVAPHSSKKQSASTRAAAASCQFDFARFVELVVDWHNPDEASSTESSGSRPLQRAALQYWKGHQCHLRVSSCSKARFPKDVSNASSWCRPNYIYSSFYNLYSETQEIVICISSWLPWLSHF